MVGRDSVDDDPLCPPIPMVVARPGTARARRIGEADPRGAGRARIAATRPEVSPREGRYARCDDRVV